MTSRFPAAVLAHLACLVLCVAGAAQQDVADREFGERAALHAAAPAVGTRVPDLVLVSLEGRPVAMTSLRGRFVVVIRAGYTSQPFRDAAAGLKKLQESFVSSPSVTFLVVVQKEPTAGDPPFAAIAQPKTFAERCALAQRMRDELDVAMPIYVDDMDDASRALFAELTSSVVVIDREGRVVDKLATPEPEPLQRAIRRVPLTEGHFGEFDQRMPNFEERDAWVRRAHLDPENRSLQFGLLESRSSTDEQEPLVEQARAALSRRLATGGYTRAYRAPAFDEERRKIEAAWRDAPMRLLAARVELAEIRERHGDRGGWADIGELPADGELGHVRSWLERRNRTAEQLMEDFDEKSRERVRERLAAHAQSSPTFFFDDKLAVVRVRFEHGNAHALEGAERLGLRFGRRVNLVAGRDQPEPIAEGERTALILQTFMGGVVYKAQLLELAKR